MVGPGATEGTDVCPCAVGMCTDDGDATDIEVDADWFTVWGAEAAIGDFCPGRFAIREFRSCVAVAVMFADGVVWFTTEDAADRVMQFAALQKQLLIIDRVLSGTRM